MSVTIAGRRYSWTQPVCDSCWRDQQGDRVPFRLTEPDREQCAYCGASTLSGIYVRVDPRTVPFPTPRPELDSEATS